MLPRSPSSILRAAKTPAILVSNLTNIRYLSGVDVSAGFVLITAKKITLLVDSRYREASAKSVRKGVKVAPIEDLRDILKSVERCGYESQDITVDKLSRMKRKFKNTKFVQTKGIIEEFRRAKDANELRKFRRAQKITHAMMARVPSVLRNGISEKQLEQHLKQWAMELGADGLAFDSIVAFGTHTSRPHHHPTTRTLRKGHIVQIDCGARYKGYCADQSQVFLTGAITPLQKKVLSAVKRAKDAAIAAVHPGASNQEIDSIARAVLKEEKLEQYFTHSLGHGVGLDIHEGLSLSTKANKALLLKNEIVTIEPGVYIPGKFGMRLEEEVVV